MDQVHIFPLSLASVYQTIIQRNVVQMILIQALFASFLLLAIDPNGYLLVVEG